MLWKRLRVPGSVAHYHPKCQSGTSAPHLDSVSVPVGKICIIRIVFQSLKVIAKGLYGGALEFQLEPPVYIFIACKIPPKM